jgi:bacterioferritin
MRALPAWRPPWLDCCPFYTDRIARVPRRRMAGLSDLCTIELLIPMPDPGRNHQAREQHMAKRKAIVTAGVLADKQKKQRDQIVAMLTKAYWMEIETVMSYIANSVNPDGLRAREVVEALETDIQEELGHAQRFAARIKELYGTVPGSLEFKAEQTFLQPPKTSTDITTIVKGVIQAEAGAIDHYQAIIEATDGVDWATQDMVIEILADEQGHMRLFEGFLRELEADGLA